MLTFLTHRSAFDVTECRKPVAFRDSRAGSMALDGLITKQRLLFVTSLYNELMRVLSAEASSNSSTATGLPLPPTAMRVSKYANSFRCAKHQYARATTSSRQGRRAAAGLLSLRSTAWPMSATICPTDKMAV